jgi:hypothetical protein
MKLGHVRILALASVLIGALYVAAMAASCGTDAQAAARELDALVLKSRNAEVTITYRLSWNDGSPEGTLVTYNDKARRTRVDLTYQRPTGAKAIRTLLLDGTDVYYCASDSPPADQSGGSKDECISHPMQTLQVELPTTKVRGITVKSRTMKTVGGKPSTCFNVEQRGKALASWTECYALDAELTYADGDHVRSLVESFGLFQILSHPVDTFSAAQSMEASDVVQTVDPQVFMPPYPVVQR